MSTAKVCAWYYFAIFFSAADISLAVATWHDKGKNLDSKARASLRSLGRAEAQPLQRRGPPTTLRLAYTED